MERLRRTARDLALPTLSGVLYFLSWIGFGLWPLGLFCLVPLLWSLREAGLRRSFRLGWWMGFVTHLGGYTWIIHLLTVFAFLPAPLSFLGYLLVCAGQGLLFGVFALALRWAWTRSRWPLAVLVPVALCATELVFPLLFQSYTGVSLLPVLPVAQLADLGGVLLLTAVQALANGALAESLLHGWRSRRATASLVTAALVLAVSGVYGRFRIAQQDAREKDAPQRRFGIAQPNVGEIELHDQPMASVTTLWDQTAELHGRGADVVVWPESGFNIAAVDISRPERGRELAHGVPVSIVAGVIRTENRRKFFNSAVMVSPEGLLGDHYDKIELLAFGEYIPFGDWFPIVYRLSPMSSHLERGTTTAPLRDGPWRYATSICYEGILPRLVQKLMADHGQGRAHVLVNLTNDSWYGAGHEQEQHLMLQVVRSIEHRRWLVRATSTGISAFVDSSGRLVQTIGRDQRGVAVHDVPMLQGTTPYEVLGDWPGFVSLLALAGIAVQDFRRRRRA